MIQNDTTTFGSCVAEKYVGTPAQDSSNAELLVLFNLIFTSTEKMMDKNKRMFLFIDKKISEGNIDLIDKLVNDQAIMDFHPSLLKTILIMTDQLKDHQNIKAARLKIDERINTVLDNY